MDSKQRVLIVEDEAKIAAILDDYLTASGYETTVLKDGSEVVQFVKNSSVDLMLLDLMLPGKNGLDICKEVRSFSKLPIIMLTAKVDEIDRIIGLEIGADDYICKPFSPREVLARIKSVLRRSVNVEISSENKTVKLGKIELDELKYKAFVDSAEVKLTPTEFKLLLKFMLQPGRVFSRSELISDVLGYDYEGYDRTIDSHIKNLRKKLSEKIANRDIIQSVYSVGYKLDI